MKNLIKISITTLGTLAILGTSVLATNGIVNAPSGLVLRQEASKTANPIITVPDKAEVNIVEKNGEWYKVTYDSQEGYLFAEYVNKKEDVNEQENERPEIQEQPVVENSNSPQVTTKLKVYNMPLITSTVINEIEPNTEITIIKQITNWSYVSAGEVQGWVRTYGLQNTVEVEKQEQPNEEPIVEQEEPTEPTVSEQENGEEDKTEEPSNTAQTETSIEAKKGFVAASNANIRKEASTNSEIVTVLSKDTSFTISAETEEWYKIKYIGIDGTVYEGYIYKPLVTF